MRRSVTWRWLGKFTFLSEMQTPMLAVAGVLAPMLSSNMLNPFQILNGAQIESSGWLV